MEIYWGWKMCECCTIRAQKPTALENRKHYYSVNNGQRNSPLGAFDAEGLVCIVAGPRRDYGWRDDLNARFKSILAPKNKKSNVSVVIDRIDKPSTPKEAQ